MLPTLSFSQSKSPSLNENRLFVPGSWAYVGDTAYAPAVIENPKPWRTVASLAAFYPEWGYSSGSTFAGRYGLLFEGIACPIPAMAALLPVGGLGSVELLGFPSGAWWGPQAGSGAVQFCAPQPAEGSQNPVSTSSWFSNRELGLGLGWTGTNAAARGAWDRRDEIASVWGNGLSGTASAEASLGGPWSLGGSTLHESSDQAEWNVVRGVLGWNSGNFQEVKIAPYVQQSRWEGLSAREGGVQVDHHFDMAGLFETNAGIGGASRTWKDGSGQGSPQFGYMRCGFFADVLGMANLDATGRWDGASGSHASPSLMGGLRVPRGPFTFEAALHRSSQSGDTPDQILAGGRVSENAFGIQVRPWNRGMFSVRYFRRTDGALRFDAWEPKMAWDWHRSILKVLKRIRLEADALYPKSLAGIGMPDRILVGRLELGLPWDWSLWSSIRLEKQQRGSVLAGLRIPRGDSAVLLEMENLGMGPSIWPDPFLEPGRRVRVSWEASF